MGTLLENCGSYLDISDIFFPVGSTKSKVSDNISKIVNKIYSTPMTSSNSFSDYLLQNINYLYRVYTQQTGGRDDGFASHPLVHNSIDALVLKYFFRSEKMKASSSALQILQSEQGDLKSKLQRIKLVDRAAFFELSDGVEMLLESTPDQLLSAGPALEPIYRYDVQKKLMKLRTFAEQSSPIFHDLIKKDKYVNKLKQVLNQIVPCGYAAAVQIGLDAEKLRVVNRDDFFYDRENAILIVRERRNNSSRTYHFTRYSIGGIATLSYVAKTRLAYGREEREMIDEGYEIVNYLGGPEVRKLDSKPMGQSLSPTEALKLAISKIKDVTDTVFARSEPLQMASWPCG